jgi:hypothetical protein
MAEGAKWTPGKIFLLVAGILVGLTLLCCGGIYLVAGDAIKGTMALARNSVVCTERLTKEFGDGTTFELVPDGSLFIPAVGVPGELTPERVVQVQDAAWRIIADVHAKDGFVPAFQLAVGKAEVGARGPGRVSGWAANVVSIDDLILRTGVARPPLLQFLPKQLSATGVDARTETRPADEGAAGGEDSGDAEK